MIHRLPELSRKHARHCRWKTSLMVWKFERQRDEARASDLRQPIEGESTLVGSTSSRAEQSASQAATLDRVHAQPYYQCRRNPNWI